MIRQYFKERNEHVRFSSLVLCTGAGGPEPEPEFCPILPEPELEPEFVHLRQNSGSTYLCCKLLS